MPTMFGIDMASTIAAAMGSSVSPATLTKVTPGARGADLGAGTNATTAAHPCRGFLGKYVERTIEGSLARERLRQVWLLAGTLPAGVAPTTGDRITIEGREWRVATVERDPSGSVYWAECR